MATRPGAAITGSVVEPEAQAVGAAAALTRDIEAAILQATTDKKRDLMVMITHGRGAFGELLFGSHPKNVLPRGKVPLLVLH